MWRRNLRTKRLSYHIGAKVTYIKQALYRGSGMVAKALLPASRKRHRSCAPMTREEISSRKWALLRRIRRRGMTEGRKEGMASSSCSIYLLTAPPGIAKAYVGSDKKLSIIYCLYYDTIIFTAMQHRCIHITYEGRRGENKLMWRIDLHSASYRLSYAMPLKKSASTSAHRRRHLA